MKLAVLEWFNPVFEWSQFCLPLAAEATLAAFPLAVIVLAIDLAFRRWMSAWQINVLWGMVLLRLMMPLAPPSAMSVQSACLAMFTDSQPPASVAHWEAAPTAYASDDAAAAAAAEAKRQAYVAEVLASKPTEVESSEPILLLILAFAVEMLLPLSWPIVATFGILWTIVANFRFTRKVNRLPFCHDERLVGLWHDCCRQANVRRTIPIVMLDDLPQPAMMGAFHHRLLLPADAVQLSDDELRMIMLHELAHVRRRDIAINWALVLVRAVHWWNPVYWLAARRFAATREQACDAFVIRQLSASSSRGYGELLLKLAEKVPGRSRWRVLVPTPILGFMLSAFRRRAIGARLKALPRAAVVRSRWHLAAVTAAIVVVGFAGLTDAKTAADGAGHDESLAEGSNAIFPATFERADVLAEELPQIDKASVTRQYNVDGVLRTLAGQRHSLDEAKQQLVAIVKQLVAPKQDPECNFDGDLLIVAARESFHEELEQNLAAWEKSGLRQICIECRFIALRQEHFSQINIPWRYFGASVPNLDIAGKAGLRPSSASDVSMPPLRQRGEVSGFRAKMQFEESQPLIYSILTHEQTRYVVVGAQMDRRAGILRAPKVTLFNGTRCQLTDITQQPFVVGVRPIVGEATTALEPQIAVYDEGTKIYLRPVLSSDHTRVELNGRFEFSQIVDVKTASVHVPASVGTPDPATIQVPQIRRLSVDLATELELGHSLLLGSPIERLDADRSATALFLLLTPTLLVEDVEAAKIAFSEESSEKLP